MSKGSEAPKKVELEEELRDLRKGVGLTRSRLGSALLRELGEDDADSAYERIIEAANSLEATKHVQAMRNALAIGSDNPGVLKARRRAFADEQQINLKTVEDWENRGFSELATVLGRTARYIYQRRIDVQVAHRKIQFIHEEVRPNSRHKTVHVSEYVNTNNLLTPNMVIYHIPDRQLQELILTAKFDEPPTQIVAGYHASPLTLAVGWGQTPVGVTAEGYRARWRYPRTDSYYALIWNW